MEVAKKFKVQVQKDHLSKVASGSPITGLCELIWNAFDADASNVDVHFHKGELGVDRVIISDDGAGISYDEAEKLFVGLGGSWKSTGQKTTKGRFLHGQEGQGRFKAFTIGCVADWKIIYEENNTFYEYTIEGSANAIDEFSLSPKKVSEHRKTGVTVEITEINQKFHILDDDKAVEALAPVFSLYLRAYHSATLRVNGNKLEAEKLIKLTKSINTQPLSIDNKKHPASIEIIEWNRITDREIWFADSNGFPLESYDKQVRGISGIGFSAYIKSDYFRELNNKGLLSLHDLEDSIRSFCDNAINTIKEYFSHRALEEASSQIQEWKEEKVYPYQGDPTTAVEDAERKVFDIIAVNINKSLPGFKASNKKCKELQLRMLRQAIEKSPEDLQTILNEVLNLPKGVRESLAELLQGTSLSSIINASKVVSDRIKFVAGLEQLVFNHKDNLKERTQLHRILAKNTWIFGNEFTLSVDDQTLTEVLKQHSGYLDSDIVINEPVSRIDGRKGIVDLMLSRQLPTNKADELEHLIVELKAPKVKIGKKEIDQIESYAFAVAKDDRFRNINTKWDFWIISNDYDDYAKMKLENDSLKDGAIYKTSKNLNITIWLKTWSQLIAENKHRLEFIREKLNYNIDRQSAVRHLKSTYSEYIEGIVLEEGK
ncbi:ATP-binding protein [Endozoicomonas sp. 4G]|uniref:ATP-binding protein n=1 Tax=Endozoicomonas sp. 4G TaxID=2872754 RepID=UPI002078FB57|nr:ATP-binding protein [Endozoicomonas sp. 4G]